MAQKTFSPISEAQIKKASIATLADRPNSVSRYGDGGLSAQELKERFDAFPALVQKKINEIIEALASGEAAKYITLNEKSNVLQRDNLYDFIALFSEDAGDNETIADFIEAFYTMDGDMRPGSYSLKEIFADIAARFATINADISKASSDIAAQRDRIATNEQKTQANVQNIASMQQAITQHDTQISSHEERITGIERYLGGDNFIVDDSTAYEKTVPKNACEKAKVLSIGGMTYKKKTDEGNLMPYPYVGIGGLGYTVDKGAVTITGGDNDSADFIISNGDGTVYPAGAYIFEVGEQSEYEVVSLGLEFSNYGATKPTITDRTNYKCLIASEGSFSITQFVAEIAGETTGVTLYPMFYKSDAHITWQPRGDWLSHTKVKAIESKGANLWKPDVTDIVAPGWITKGELKELAENVWYQGLSGSDYWDSAAVSNVIITGNKVSFHTTGSGYGMTRAFKCKPNTAYTLSIDYEGDFSSGCAIGYYDANGHWLDYDWDAIGIVTPANCYWLTVNLSSNDAPSNCTFSNIMFAESDVEIPYTPYVGTIDTFTIPEEVQAVEGFGLGIEGYPNTVEYANGRVKLDKRVKEAVVDKVNDVSWADYTNIKYYAFNMPSDYIGYKTDAFMLEGFNKKPSHANWDSTDYVGVATGLATEYEIWVGFPKGTTLEEAKAALLGKSFVYRLTVPEIEDISDIMPKENLIKVLGGCRIVAENEQSDPVPFSIKYLVTYPKGG